MAGNTDDTRVPLIDNSKEETPKLRRVYDCLTAPFRQFWDSGYACLLMAVLVYTVVRLSVKMLSDRFPVFQLTAVRSGVGIIITMILSSANHLSLTGPKNLLHLTITRGVFSGLAVVCLYAALYLLPMGDVVAIFKMNPGVTSLLLWMLGIDTINAFMSTGVLACMSGVLFIAQPPFLFGGTTHNSGTMYFGLALAFGANLLVSGAFVTLQKIGKRVPSLTVVFWFHACSILFSIPGMLIGFPSDPKFDIKLDECIWWAAFVASSFFAQLFATRGMQLCSSSVGTAVLTMELVTTYMAGYFLLGESTSRFDVFGGAFIAGGVIVVAIGKQKKKERESVMVNEFEKSDTEKSENGEEDGMP